MYESEIRIHNENNQERGKASVWEVLFITQFDSDFYFFAEHILSAKAQGKSISRFCRCKSKDGWPPCHENTNVMSINSNKIRRSFMKEKFYEFLLQEKSRKE